MLQSHFMELECQRMDRYSCDGASWSIVFEEGKPLDAVSSGATTSAIGAMTSRAGRSTLDGRLSHSSNSG
ncbi:hypothetical protein Tco_1462185 [Tanacetum coccineum]